MTRLAHLLDIEKGFARKAACALLTIKYTFLLSQLQLHMHQNKHIINIVIQLTIPEHKYSSPRNISTWTNFMPHKKIEIQHSLIFFQRKLTYINTNLQKVT